MEKGTESLFKEIIADNFPNLGKKLDLEIHEASRTLNYINAKRPSPRHIIVKLAKVNDKEKILRAARQKKIGFTIRLSANFLTETLQARREWNDIFKILKDKNFQPRILYLAKRSFRYDGEIITIPDKQKLREFIATRPPLQEMLKRPSSLRKKRESGFKVLNKEGNRSTKPEKLQSSIKIDYNFIYLLFPQSPSR